MSKDQADLPHALLPWRRAFNIITVEECFTLKEDHGLSEVVLEFQVAGHTRSLAGWCVAAVPQHFMSTSSKRLGSGGCKAIRQHIQWHQQELEGLLRLSFLAAWHGCIGVFEKLRVDKTVDVDPQCTGLSLVGHAGPFRWGLSDWNEPVVGRKVLGTKWLECVQLDAPPDLCAGGAVVCNHVESTGQLVKVICLIPKVTPADKASMSAHQEGPAALGKCWRSC
eukprot:55017-Amphidinium_carterae.3